MRVLVTGGTGFVGTHLVNALLRRRHSVAVLARDAQSARNRYNRPVETVAGNVLDSGSLDRAVSGRDAVIHLVGIIHETGEQTFDRMHRVAVENVVGALQRRGPRRLLHMSAMGVGAGSPSEYGRTKAAGEAVVRGSGLDWTIFRPSITFGPGDGFVSLLAPIVRHNPLFIPVIGRGTTRFQPVSVYDVARVFTDALEKPETIGRSFEVGGPHVFTLDELYREIAVVVGKPRKRAIHFPVWWGKLLAGGFEWLARRGIIDSPPLTKDQLRSLAQDNVADTSETEAVFGGEWRELRPGLREYLHGAFAHDPRSGFGDEVELERVRTLRLR
ncbi:MAG: complex I NDUFA9 subunit family protein [Thermoanaerobaculia bacterium]|nr:complex I NDUFA9 subunit family protein [Thermoanaerobaculia bacterium]